jgi:dienelactone hydrolase
MQYRFMKNILITAIAVVCSFTLMAQNFNIGSTTVNFIDPDRNNRQVSTAIYYPATGAGNNAPVAAGEFPVVAFGHGFVMVHTAYQFLWTDLVPRGYIVAFPTTEGSFSPSHLNFGLDLAFIINKMKQEGQNPASMFFGAVAETSAIMGHSMGGGASFLACADNSVPTTMVTFAAANTSPSSIQAAANVNIPTLLFAGEFDCVTPPSQHQYPMYEATASQQKIIVDILGGGHCFFGDPNFFCSVGEGSCNPQPAISRQQQQAITLNFLNPYFDYMLKNEFESWLVFLDSLQTSQSIDYLIEWSTLHTQLLKDEADFKTFPNPFRRSITVEIPSTKNFDSLVFFDINGRLIHQEAIAGRQTLEISARHWSAGVYIATLISENEVLRKKVFKR